MYPSTLPNSASQAKMSQYVLRDENQENVQPRKAPLQQAGPQGGRTVLGVLQENRGLRGAQGRGGKQHPVRSMLSGGAPGLSQGGNG